MGDAPRRRRRARRGRRAESRDHGRLGRAAHLMVHHELHGEPTGRPPLLLTHGFGATARMWAPNLAALTADRQALTWDLPGHGRSATPARLTHDDCVADMAVLVDA